VVSGATSNGEIPPSERVWQNPREDLCAIADHRGRLALPAGQASEVWVYDEGVLTFGFRETLFDNTRIGNEITHDFFVALEKKKR
jgi:hypothetical protein